MVMNVAGEVDDLQDVESNVLIRSVPTVHCHSAVARPYCRFDQLVYPFQ